MKKSLKFAGWGCGIYLLIAIIVGSAMAATGYDGSYENDTTISEVRNTIVEDAPVYAYEKPKLVSGTCNALTKKGTPCRNKVKRGEYYCWRHK